MFIKKLLLISVFISTSFHLSASEPCNSGTSECSIKGESGDILSVDNTGKISFTKQRQSYLGEVITFMSVNFIPEGCLPANGQTIQAQDFPEFVKQATGNDYATEYTLPNLNGMFLRTIDKQGQIDPNREELSTQGDAIRNITGNINVLGDISAKNDGVFKHTENHRNGGLIDGVLFGRNIINFDASRVVPVANENRPVNIAVARCIVVK